MCKVVVNKGHICDSVTLRDLGRQRTSMDMAQGNTAVITMLLLRRDTLTQWQHNQSSENQHKQTQPLYVHLI